MGISKDSFTLIPSLRNFTHFLLELGASPPLNFSGPPGLKAYADDGFIDDDVGAIVPEWFKLCKMDAMMTVRGQRRKKKGALDFKI